MNFLWICFWFCQILSDIDHNHINESSRFEIPWKVQVIPIFHEITFKNQPITSSLLLWKYRLFKVSSYCKEGLWLDLLVWVLICDFYILDLNRSLFIKTSLDSEQKESDHSSFLSGFLLVLQVGAWSSLSHWQFFKAFKGFKHFKQLWSWLF